MPRGKPVPKGSDVFTVRGKRYYRAQHAVDVATELAAKSGRPVSVGKLGYGNLHTVYPDGSVGQGWGLSKDSRRLPNPGRVKLPSKWTNAKVRVDAKGRVQIGLAKNPFLGKGGTLAKGVRSVKAAAKKITRKGNGRTYAVKGERVAMSHEPKAGEVWYLSGRRAVIKRVGTSDGTPYVWFVRPVDGTVAMSTRNLVSGGYLEKGKAQNSRKSKR